MRTRIEKLRSEKYKHLVDVLFLIALVQALLLIFVPQLFISEDSFLYDTLVRVAGFEMMFLFGCAGIVSMIRQEFRQMITLRGRAAQSAGFLFWIVSWGMALYILLYIVKVSR